jgi:CheY-like chemotaxis protein
MAGTPDVLVVDDDRSIRTLVDELLTAELGARVRGAGDGYEAMRAVLAARPALVLLDLMLPNLDGLTVLRWLRGRPGLADVPVIALTGMPRERAELALERGADGVVLKPFDLDELVRLAGQLIAGASERRAGGRGAPPGGRTI